MFALLKEKKADNESGQEADIAIDGSTDENCEDKIFKVESKEKEERAAGEDIIEKNELMDELHDEPKVINHPSNQNNKAEPNEAKSELMHAQHVLETKIEKGRHLELTFKYCVYNKAAQGVQCKA
eukprot:14055420-Ditylum_brightwellii.AAC.1